jgi:hypothetical protein
MRPWKRSAKFGDQWGSRGAWVSSITKDDVFLSLLFVDHAITYITVAQTTIKQHLAVVIHDIEIISHHEQL